MICESVSYFARARGDKPACIEVASGATLSYAALERRSRRMAAILRSRLGAPEVRGARVAVLARTSSDVICLHLACRGSAAIFVPFNWRLSGAELAQLAALAQPAIVFFDAEFAATAAALASAGGAELIELGGRQFEAELARADESAAVVRPAAPDDVITLLFTSGTTGRPKGVTITERNARVATHNYALSAAVDSGTVSLCQMPLFHVVGLFTVACTVLQAGGTLLLSPQFSADETLDLVADAARGVTHYFCVPQMADRLREARNFDPAILRRLRVLQTGGAPHPAASVRRWVSEGVRCADGFGMTEAAGTVLGMPPFDLELLARKAGCAGIASASIEVRLTDAQGRDVDDGAVGELCLRGPSITPGYWRDRAATETAFRDGWLRTGDVARRDADGFYTLVDRCKDMYISGGENVYPAEVEAALLTTGLFREAAVIGVPDARWGESGVAYVVMAQASAVTDAELLALCRDRLAAYKLPREFRRVDELPRTASGKIRKDMLRSRWQTA